MIAAEHESFVRLSRLFLIIVMSSDIKNVQPSEYAIHVLATFIRIEQRIQFSTLNFSTFKNAIAISPAQDCHHH